jgi:hypothetical protein
MRFEVFIRLELKIVKEGYLIIKIRNKGERRSKKAKVKKEMGRKRERESGRFSLSPFLPLTLSPPHPFSSSLTVSPAQYGTYSHNPGYC